MTTHQHTPRDLEEFARVGIDPDTTQGRDHPVRCLWCSTTTFNQRGECDRHYRPLSPDDWRVGAVVEPVELVDTPIRAHGAIHA